MVIFYNYVSLPETNLFNGHQWAHCHLHPECSYWKKKPAWLMIPNMTMVCGGCLLNMKGDGTNGFGVCVFHGLFRFGIHGTFLEAHLGVDSATWSLVQHWPNVGRYVATRFMCMRDFQTAHSWDFHHRICLEKDRCGEKFRNIYIYMGIGQRLFSIYIYCSYTILDFHIQPNPVYFG